MIRELELYLATSAAETEHEHVDQDIRVLPYLATSTAETEQEHVDQDVRVPLHERQEGEDLSTQHQACTHNANDFFYVYFHTLLLYSQDKYRHRPIRC